MTCTLPDVDELAALDWHHEEPACEVPKCDSTAGTPVTHRIVSLACGCRPVLVCTPCAADFARHLDDVWRLPICKRCRTVKPPGSRLGDLYRLEPLS